MGLEPELDNKDFPAWSLLEQPWIVSGLKDTACMAGVEAPEEFLVTADLVSAGVTAAPTADLIERRQQLKSSNKDLFAHYLERFGRG